MIQITVTENLANLRMNKALHKILPKAKDGFLYKMMRKKNITRNRKKISGEEVTLLGDTIEFFFSEETFRSFAEEVFLPEPEPEMPLTVLYEDHDLCIFIKPVGLLSQKAVPSDYSANDWLLSHGLKDGYIKKEDLRLVHPSVVNRLDRNTYGIMAGGYSLKGLQILSELFKSHRIEKYYLAVCLGEAKESDSLKGYFVKDASSNKTSISVIPKPDSVLVETDYERISYDSENDLSLLRVHLKTGKSHQIRCHLASVGHPLLGDPKYGRKETNRKFHQSVQCLASVELSFPSCDLAVSGKTFTIPVPPGWPSFQEMQ